MRIATHNVWVNLDDTHAEHAVAKVLRYEPDIIGLQEWGRSRRSILRDLGRVTVFPKIRYHVGPPHKQVGYVFAYPLGGQPVGVNAAKVEIVAVRRRKLSEKRPGVRPTHGTELIAQLRETNETVAVLNVHPVAHHDRPENKAAHTEAVESIREWAEEWRQFRCYVVGDMNARNVKIPGLRSCWEGRPAEGTFRGRPIDHIYGPHPFGTVRTVNTTSDHHAVVADDTQEKP